MTARTPSPAVTCVLIFLDGARFIDEAIRSVVAQSGDVDWELVLVDDGSTDESTVIARRWASADARIRYLEHEGHANLGMSASRNAGVAVARGDLIGFLDCDDVWLPLALSHGLGVLALHPDADVVIGATWRWYSWTGEPGDRAHDDVMRLPDVVPLTVIDPPALLAGMYAKPGAWQVPAMCSLLISRHGLLRIGGLDDSFRGIYEDQVLYTKIAMHLQVVVDPRPMGLYRQHDASACHVAVDAGVWRRSGPSELERHYLEWVRTYVTEQAGGDPAALDVVARNLDHVAHGQHLAPTEPSPSLGSRLPTPVRRVLRAVRDRVRPPARPTSVTARWSEQFLAPISGQSDGYDPRRRGGRQRRVVGRRPAGRRVRRPCAAAVMERGDVSGDALRPGGGAAGGQRIRGHRRPAGERGPAPGTGRHGPRRRAGSGAGPHPPGRRRRRGPRRRDAAAPPGRRGVLRERNDRCVAGRTGRRARRARRST